MDLSEIRAHLVRMLERAQAGRETVDPIAHSFESGRVTGLEDAIKLIDKALQEEHAARIKGAGQGRTGE